MEDDEELKRLRQKMFRDLKKTASEKDKRAFRKQKGSVLNKPIEVTDATFAETIHNHPLVVVDCWAAWCTPCHMIAPLVEGMARDYAGKVLFGKLNVDENRRVAMQYQIMSIPTLLVFKKGRLVDRLIGVMPRQMLEPKIARYLQ